MNKKCIYCNSPIDFLRTLENLKLDLYKCTICGKTQFIEIKDAPDVMNFNSGENFL